MDNHQFDDLTRSLTAASRRGLLAGLASGLLAVLPLALVSEESEGKKKKKKKRRKKPAPTLLAPPPPPLPPPPPPLTGPGSCAFVSGVGFGGRRRFAQTFLPPHGGQLTAAEIFLRINPANFSLDFEIRGVDAAGVPTSTILGTTTVTNIPATALADPPRSAIATFATPATLTLGQPYALSVTGPANTQYRVHANTDGNPCSDGMLFGDLLATGDFQLTSGGANADLVYAVTIGASRP